MQWMVDFAALWMLGSILLSLTLQEHTSTKKTTEGGSVGNAKSAESDQPNLNLERLRSELESPSKTDTIDVEQQE